MFAEQVLQAYQDGTLPKMYDTLDLIQQRALRHVLFDAEKARVDQEIAAMKALHHGKRC